jgi:hypothetical protein
MNFEPLFELQIHPGIARAAQYCLDLSQDRELPRRRDFRPANVRSILGYIFLIDVLPDDYGFGLAGEHMATLYGATLKGKRLSEIKDEKLRDHLGKTYDAVVSARSFQYLRGRYTWPARSVPIERLLVPMTDDAGKLSTIFGFTIPNIPADTLILSAGEGAATLEIDTEYDSLLGAS